MPNALVTFQNVSFAWGETRVLDELSFGVKSGELLAITGPTGCGKSTLLRLISTLEPGFKGQIVLGDRELTQMSPRDIRSWRAKMGVALSPPGLFDWLTARAGLEFVLRQRADGSGFASKALEVLDAVGLSHAAALLPSQMSGGMQKRLAIARALVTDPQLVLLDDPTAGLDPVTGRAVADLIFGLKQQITLVLAVSDPVLVSRLADTVVFLVEGRVRFFGGAQSFQRSRDPYVRQFLDGRIEGPIA